MKEYRFIMGMFFVVLLIPFVSGAISLSESELAFGGSGFEKTTTKQTKSITLNIQTPTTNLTSLSLGFNPQNSFSASNVNMQSLPALVAGSTTLTVELSIGDFDAIDNEFKERGQITIGLLKISGVENNGQNTITTNEIPIKLEVENNLEIDEIEATDEDDNTNTISSGTSYDLTEDEEVTLKIKVKNTFSSNGLDMKNIEVVVDSDDFDINENKGVDDLEAEDTAEVEISFSVDEIKNGDVDILLEGEDELGGKHGEKLTFQLNVQEKPAEENNDPINEAGDDSDGDGIGDILDICPNTVSSCSVDSNGCPLDADDDGACDDLDPTPNGIQQATEENEELTQPVKKISAQETSNEAAANEKAQTSFEGETEGVIPFLIGLVIGICLTAGFFWLIKS